MIKCGSIKWIWEFDLVRSELKMIFKFQCSYWSVGKNTETEREISSVANDINNVYYFFLKSFNG